MIANENLDILFRFRFHNGKANKFLQIFFRICFVMDMLGTHKPQVYATLTNKNNISEMIFCFLFRNSTERISQILGFWLIFTCNCFCEDGTLAAINQAKGRVGVAGPAAAAAVAAAAATAWRSSGTSFPNRQHISAVVLPKTSKRQLNPQLL